MDGPAAHRRRPRPVADAPPCDAVAVAKGWLIALVADAPLHQAASVPAAELARGGPALCGAVLEALRSDEALDRLVGGDGRAPLAGSVGRLAGARSPAAVAAAVDALRAVLWHALTTELRDPLPTLVTDLADRLAYVCARLTEASLSAPIADPPGRAGPLADALAATPAESDADAASPPEREPEPDAVSVPDDPPPPPGVQVISMPADPSPDVSGPYVFPREPEPEEPAAELEPEPVGVAPPEGVVAVPQPSGTPVVTRLHPGGDVWADDGVEAPPWLAAITRRLERRAQDGLPFAVLVVEVDELDRLLASEPGREVAFALEVAERGLTAELAPADLVVRERLGRWWLTSPDRDSAAARDLGTRVAAAIGRAVLGGGALRASIGVAVCPDDGDSVDALASRADQGMFAARAAGVPLA